MAQLFPVNTQIDSRKVISIVMLILTLIGGIVFYIQYLIGPMDYFSSTKVEVNISTGSNLAGIARALQEAGLIRNSAYFISMSRYKGVEGKLKAGYYEFNTQMSLVQIIDKIVAGEVATFRLTIPEGLSVYEMAPLIGERTGISAYEFITVARDYRLDFVPEQEFVQFQVEGFLFPDTYHIPVKATAQDLIRMMVNRFKRVVGVNSVEVRGRTLNVWEIVTIASLIEEEAKFDFDRLKISGVIYNRLEKRMNLQLCASVLYVLGVKKERLSLQDTRIDSPYNTYQNSGLPPGPISNPGLKSIQAALQPEEVPYYFYFSVPDGTTYYNRTYEEHLKGVKKYLD